jgi:uncharacterized protein YjbJ (UPF0337 family)
MMAEKIDKAKGRTKEAAGDLAGDRKLKREGKVDRASGAVKGKVGDAADKAKDAVNPRRT